MADTGVATRCTPHRIDEGVDMSIIGKLRRPHDTRKRTSRELARALPDGADPRQPRGAPAAPEPLGPAGATRRHHPARLHPSRAGARDDVAPGPALARRGRRCRHGARPGRPLPRDRSVLVLETFDAAQPRLRPRRRRRAGWRAAAPAHRPPARPARRWPSCSSASPSSRSRSGSGSVDPIEHAAATEYLTEIGVIVALMGAGLKLDRPLGLVHLAADRAAAGHHHAAHDPADGAARLVGRRARAGHGAAARRGARPDRPGAGRRRAGRPAGRRPARGGRPPLLADLRGGPERRAGLPVHQRRHRDGARRHRPQRLAARLVHDRRRSTSSPSAWSAVSWSASCWASSSSARRRTCGWPRAARASSRWRGPSWRTALTEAVGGYGFLAVFVAAVALRRSEERPRLPPDAARLRRADRAAADDRAGAAARRRRRRAASWRR